MKKLFLTLCAVMTMALTAGAAEENQELPLHAEISLGSATPSHQVQPFNAVIDVNYHIIPCLSIRAVAQADYFLPKNGATKDYNKDFNLGGGIGYTFPRDAKDLFVYEARAFVTTSLNSCTYKNTSYNIGLYIYGNSSRHRIVPLLGIGYNFKDYKAEGLSSYNGAYLTLGLRF